MGINLKIMSKRKGSVYKKKKGLVKDLTRNILQEFNRDPKKILNEAKKVFKNTVLASDLDEFDVE